MHRDRGGLAVVSACWPDCVESTHYLRRIQSVQTKLVSNHKQTIEAADTQETTQEPQIDY